MTSVRASGQKIPLIIIDSVRKIGIPYNFHYMLAVVVVVVAVAFERILGDARDLYLYSAAKLDIVPIKIKQKRKSANINTATSSPIR